MYPSSATVVFVQVVPLLLADTLDTTYNFFNVPVHPRPIRISGIKAFVLDMPG